MTQFTIDREWATKFNMADLEQVVKQHMNECIYCRAVRMKTKRLEIHRHIPDVEDTIKMRDSIRDTPGYFSNSRLVGNGERCH